MAEESRLAQLSHHRMRAYYIPFVAGAVLAASAFFPRIRLGEIAVGGIPMMSGLSTLALGLIAMLLAGLSVWTRKNSRHPLLLVGLVALGIEFLGWQWMERSVSSQAWATAQAHAIVEGGTMVDPVAATRTVALWLALAASIVITGFGLTIIVKRISTPYYVEEDEA
jgi:hypothetical protein